MAPGGGAISGIVNADPRGVARFGPIDEWHVDLEKIVTMERLGSYPACPDSRKKPDLRAIRPIDRGVSVLRALWTSACAQSMKRMARRSRKNRHNGETG